MASHLTKADAHLLSVPGANRKKQITLDPSSSSAFTSTLSSLISSSTSTKHEVSRGRARPSKNKSDIFTSHNKGSKKRAARDLVDSEDTLGSGKIGRQDIGGVDEAVLARSKKALEEKARRYRELKHSSYVPEEEDKAGLIEWDRKWAENGRREFDSDSNDSDGEGEINPEANEVVEYEDEFGRLRTGTRAEMERMERMKRNELLGAEELERMSARPKMPENLIVGPTVQTNAFMLDEESERKMEELAKKRDRSLTPPPAEHYDARKEFRQRGTGFFAFSKDEEERQEQMRSLEEQRRETERVRRERGLDRDEEKPVSEERHEKRAPESMQASSLMARMRAQSKPDAEVDRRPPTPGTDSKTDENVNEGGSGLMARMRARMMAENFIDDLENEILTAKRPKTDDN